MESTIGRGCERLTSHLHTSHFVSKERAIYQGMYACIYVGRYPGCIIMVCVLTW